MRLLLLLYFAMANIVIAMKKKTDQARYAGRYKTLRRPLLSGVLVSLLCTACAQTLPELEPEKFVAPTPSEAWKPEASEISKPLPAERLPEPAQTLEEISSSNSADVDKLTLVQLAELALRNNPTTRGSWQQAQAVAAAWGRARGAYYPQVNGYLSLNRYDFGSSQGKTAFDETDQIVGGEFSYLLLDAGGRGARAEAARQALLASNWNHNQVIQNTIRDVATAYYAYIGAKARQRAVEVSLKEAETSLEVAEGRRKRGAATVVDALQARAKLALVRVELEARRGILQTSRGDLATVVGWSADTEFDVIDEYPSLKLDLIEQGVKSLIARAREGRPDLAAVRAAVLEKESEVHDAKSDLWPKLVANAGIERERVRGTTRSDSTNWLTGIELKIPLFQGFQLRNAVREARAELQATESALARQEQMVIDDVWSAFYDLRTASEQIKASEVLLKSATEAFNAAADRYRAGVGDIVELLNAQTTLSDARSRRVQADTDLYTSYAALLHAMGSEMLMVPSTL